ncbi:MAG: CoA transferase [Desulfobacterales bacterium]|nr:CoA transferase [Desulfobacterales bacterium]MCP4163201.1 CoA transferase [Deltaproteobacteria bacterium]
MFSKGALDGVKVLDLSRLLPGPFCSMVLADHGADVTSVEDKKFQSDGLFFNDVNRNKRHMSLDLKKEKGMEIFYKLAKDTDVILEGFRPGVVKRLGVDYESIKKINPNVIYCSITGYGQDGPMRDIVGHDVNYMSTAGVLDLVGSRDQPPTIPGVQLADIAGGSMNAVIGILMALYSRSVTGKGQYIDISMTDGMIPFMTLPLYFSSLGMEQKKSDTIFSHRYAFYNTYETKDGKHFSIGAVEFRFWKQLCDYLEVPEYANLQYDENRKDEIIRALQNIFLTKTIDEWDAELKDKEFCYSRVLNLDEMMNSNMAIEREMVVEQKQKDGSTKKALGIPVKLSETPGSVRTPPDSFGESSRDILRELGYSNDEIDKFSEKEVF